MKDQTLRDVNDNLIEAGEFLKDIANNPKRIQCLKTFSECKAIVEWLRKVTKGLMFTEYQFSFKNVLFCRC